MFFTKSHIGSDPDPDPNPSRLGVGGPAITSDFDSAIFLHGGAIGNPSLGLGLGLGLELQLGFELWLWLWFMLRRFEVTAACMERSSEEAVGEARDSVQTFARSWLGSGLGPG